MRRYKKCRWGDVDCRRSHNRPSAATLARLASDESALTLLDALLVEDKVARAAAGRAQPLPEWFHAARRELVFQCGGEGGLTMMDPLGRMREAVRAFLGWPGGGSDEGGDDDSKSGGVGGARRGARRW